jgi:hypothetical protein
MAAWKQQGIYYQIVVQGHLEPNWCEWFDGMSIQKLPSEETVLSGLIIDQSALHGVLIKIRDLGLPLISVQRVKSNQKQNDVRRASNSIKGARRVRHQYILKEKGGNKMLFMAIFTFDPEKKEAVIKRRAGKGPQTAGKLIGEWGTIAGGCTFRVIEEDDPKAMLAAVAAWSDLGKIELIPIMTTEDIVKAAASQQ